MIWVMHLILAISVSHAVTPHSENGSGVPCAILEKFDGQVQILSPEKDQLIASEEKANIPCSGWISVKTGWAEIRHKQGFSIRLGAQSFIELFDYKKTDSGTELTGQDHVVLYRGKALVRNPGGLEELRVVTANARSRIPVGVALVLYDPLTEETQHIALENPSSLESRFEYSQKRMIQQGETTQLSFKALRVIPTEGAAMKVAVVRDRIADLNLDPREAVLILTVIQSRADRKFAAEIPTSGPKNSRMPASEASATGDEIENQAPMPGAPDAHKHLKDSKKNKGAVAITGPALKSHWHKRLVGDESFGMELLYGASPKKGRFPASQNPLAVDLVSPIEKKRIRDEAEEKRRVLDEISRIDPSE